MTAVLLGGVLALPAQKVQDRPATDTSAQASPIEAVPRLPATDASAEASPERGPHVGLPPRLAPNQPVRVVLGRAIDSGRLKNGDTVPAKLTAPVRTTAGRFLPPDTNVVVTVVETAPAGRLTAAGEFSLQVVRVGNITTATDFKVYRGKPGPKELADAAPAIGTDAGLPAGAVIEFHVLNPDKPANGRPDNAANVPGAVNGTASGSAPPASARSNAGEPVFGGGGTANGRSDGRSNGQNSGQSSGPGNKINTPAQSVQPASNNAEPAQHEGQAGAAPNQPSAPTGAQPGSSTQPH